MKVIDLTKNNLIFETFGNKSMTFKLVDTEWYISSVNATVDCFTNIIIQHEGKQWLCDQVLISSAGSDDSVFVTNPIDMETYEGKSKFVKTAKELKAMKKNYLNINKNMREGMVDLSNIVNLEAKIKEYMICRYILKGKE